MATPASAIPGYRQLSFRPLADLNAEREQLKIDIVAARFRESELMREIARNKELLGASLSKRAGLIARINQSKMRSPASNVSAPTVDSLINKLKTEKDPRERYRIQERINALSV